MDNLSQTTSAGNAPPEMADLTGKTLADFRLLRRLGQGGMGQVYLAEQVSLNRKVALKLLRPDFAANKTALERFKLEAKAVAQATHANIVQVYQVGEEQSLHFMALEYVEGRNLREFIARKGPPEVLLALSIMRQVAAALQRASELGIIHRDIKPENILLTKKGEVKVADFGLSRVLEGDKPAVNLTQSGVTMGTPLYMSPEQVEGKTIDFRTDIYSFGVTCYHMLAGEPPFKGGSAFEVALKHVREEAPPLPSIRPDLPTDLCAVVHKMMAKEPADRYQSCKELLKDLAVLRESLSGQTGFVALAATGFLDKGEKSGGGLTALSARTTRMPSRSRRVLLAALFLLSVLAAGTTGGVFGWMQHRDVSPGDHESGGGEPGLALDSASLDEREKEREKRLKAEIEHHLDPAKGYTNPKLGAETCLEYLLPMLKRPGRLDEADEVFKRLAMIHTVEQYYIVGTLGHGIVLALKNDWEESNKTFRSLIIERRKKPGDIVRPRAIDPERVKLVMQTMPAHPDLPRWLREAAWRNSISGANASREQEMPQYLKKLLERDRPPPPPKGKDKDKPPERVPPKE